LRLRGWGILASGLGSGLSPVAPGTAGTLAAVPLAWMWSRMPAAPHAVLLLLLLPLGAWVCGRAARGQVDADPSWIVLDEMVGYWFAVAFVPFGWSTWGVGFFLFRLFDILKPQPAAWIDRNMLSGWGILLDDVFAGIYTRAALEVLGRLGVV